MSLVFFQSRPLTLDIWRNTSSTSAGRNLAQSLALLRLVDTKYVWTTLRWIKICENQLRRTLHSSAEALFVRRPCTHALLHVHKCTHFPTDFLSSRKLHVPRLAGKKRCCRVVQLLNTSTSLLLRDSELAFSKKYEVPLLTALAN